MKGQNKAERYSRLRDGAWWHTRVPGAERSLKAGVRSSASLSSGPLVDAVLSGLGPTLPVRSDSSGSVVPKSPFEDSQLLLCTQLE